ncbi:MAG: glycosyltransferase family 2 protein [Oscillospiraceae bacterium]|nr:glycosyltransferase family 2 protein [Oscillospiraceae bacterium]
MNKTLYIVIPCYNEEAVLPVTAPMFLDKLNSMINKDLCSPQSRIVFVNDGSKDTTWDIIQKLSQENEKFTGVCLTRNQGHQNALLAGLMWAKDRCDVTISIDCDGQDDMDAMDEMMKNYHDGCHIVYGVRSKRESDTFFKRFTAESFYKFMRFMGVESVYNHADYRLMSSQSIQALSQFKEVNLYLRGMVPMVGYKSTAVYYERNERLAGESHYPFSKMMNLALNGITSLSVKPLRYITSLGFVMGGVSFCIMLYALWSKFFGETVTGWTSMVAAMCLISGIQLICLGIIGEYVGKIYSETKERPKYIIQETTEDNKKDQAE